MQKIDEKETLFENTEQDVGRIGTAEIVVGIPTYNNHETVARAVEAGLDAASGRLSGKRIVIINADGASQDGTPEHLREIVGEKVPLLQVRYPVYPVDRLAAPLAGVPGRKEAAVTIFQYARQLGARACVLLDAEVESITPEWIDSLTRPVLDDAADLMVPLHLRGRFDGLINTGILSPFARALFGKRLRQPSGADLAFSAPLMAYYTGQVASAAPAPSTLDPWSAISAVIQGFRVGQSFLGPRLTRAREVPLDLSTILQQVLANTFDLAERSASFWQKVRGSEAVPWFGPALEIEAKTPEPNRKPMIDSFLLGCHDLVEIWRLILPPATLLDLRRLERQPEAAFRMADELWARVVYDFAIGYHLRVIGRDHLLRAITPLYLGWAASFMGEMQNAGAVELEARLEQLATQFEAQKRYLISRWRWPDKFNP